MQLKSNYDKNLNYLLYFSLAFQNKARILQNTMSQLNLIKTYCDA